MTPGEIFWRVRSSLRDRIDRLLVGQRQKLNGHEAILNGSRGGQGKDFRVSDIAVGDGSRLKAVDDVVSAPKASST